MKTPSLSGGAAASFVSGEGGWQPKIRVVTVMLRAIGNNLRNFIFVLQTDFSEKQDQANSGYQQSQSKSTINVSSM
jgi:hypothetical protein